ncbi:MAG: hypothetical protein ACREAB_05135 [Blastocatellia bacterium]
MKYLASLCFVTILALASAGAANAQNRPDSNEREVLTNEAVINLSKAGFKDRTIINLIRNSDTAFDISTPKLVELKKRGVNEKVINEMVERTSYRVAAQRLTSLRDDEFFAKDDEAFFNGPIFKELPTEKEAKKREDEAMIFGSQSGSGSRNRSRGGLGPNGDRSQQTETTGSASVRIIRPGESASEPKLQRAPKLENKDVMAMVEAGFSEGTVIRKIESSQVDFDLSSKSLVALRQNRVSERIITAMKTAMDESK